MEPSSAPGVRSKSGSSRSRRHARALTARTNVWMLKHGRPPVPRHLSAKERREVDDCFELLDEDGSGTLDPDELLKAFHLLGLSTSKSHVIRLMREIDSDGNGEIDQQEFRSLMAQQIGQTASQVMENEPEHASEWIQERSLPLQTMLLAFRRRKTLQDFLLGGESRTKARVAQGIDVQSQRATTRSCRPVDPRETAGDAPSLRASFVSFGSVRGNGIGSMASLGRDENKHEEDRFEAE